MNDYLGNLVARSRNAAGALRPQFAHPYESLGEPSGPVAAPFPEVAVPGMTAPVGPGEAPSEAAGEAPSGRAARTGAASHVGHTEAVGAKSPAGHAGTETTSQTASQTASHAPPRTSDAAAVRPLSRGDSTPGEISRPSPTTDASHANPPRVSPRGEEAAPRAVPDATEGGPARASHTRAQRNEPRQGRASGMPASTYAAPPDARQTGGLEPFTSHAAPDVEGAARVVRVEASLAPPSQSPPADGRQTRSGGPGLPARQDALVPLVPATSRPAAPDLMRVGESETPAPTIRVTIGRVEVRAVTPTPEPSRKPARPAPRISLDEYLRSQNGGRG